MGRRTSHGVQDVQSQDLGVVITVVVLMRLVYYIHIMHIPENHEWRC